MDRMLYSVVLTVILATLGAAKQLNFKDCGSVGGKIESLDVSPCETDPCVIHHGTNYTINMNISAVESSSSAKTVVHGIIGGIAVPFPVPSDCCANNNLKCPIASGTTVTYTNSLYCAPEYPKIKLVAKWEIQDESGKDFICFAVPLEIQD